MRACWRFAVACVHPLQLNALGALAISWLPPALSVRRGFDTRLALCVRIREVGCDLVEEIGGIAELEQELHAREVDPARLREVADRAHPLEIVVRVEADVRVRSHRIEQPLLLIDAQGARMAAGETGGDADHVHRSTSAYHNEYLKAYQWRCQESSCPHVRLGAGRPAETLFTRRGPTGLAAGSPSRGGPRQASPAPYASGPVRFGLDFGTSNTSLALWKDGRSTVLPIDAVAGETMPTVLYIRRDGTPIVGRPAIDAYLEDNRSRGPVSREFHSLGILMPSSNPDQPIVEAHIYTDVNAPGRLCQALKTFLGDPLETRTNVFGNAKGLEELIALILVHVRNRAKDLVGTAPEAITLGRPVRFIGDEGAEHRATGRLRAAAYLAGFRDIRFVAEPVAAAHAALVAPGTSLVFDFGGGTLDLCVVRRDERGLAVLATAGGPIGGDRATELLIDDLV